MDRLQSNLFPSRTQAADEIYFDYKAEADKIVSRLDAIHWSSEHLAYLDTGMHTDKGKRVTEVAVRCVEGGGGQQDFAIPVEVSDGEAHHGCPPSHPVFLAFLADPKTGSQMTRTRTVPDDIRYQHVPRIGYVCLFPLLLKLLPPDSDKLPFVLDTLEDPDQLWTRFGLRSLSANDTYYKRNNAPHDSPYWRYCTTI
jgi:mannosyl-oligosaccharide glucosidase